MFLSSLQKMLYLINQANLFCNLNWSHDPQLEKPWSRWCFAPSCVCMHMNCKFLLCDCFMWRMLFKKFCTVWSGQLWRCDLYIHATYTIHMKSLLNW